MNDTKRVNEKGPLREFLKFWLLKISVRGRSGSVWVSFGVRARSVRGPFGVRAKPAPGPRGVLSGSVRGAYVVRSGSVRDPKPPQRKKKRNLGGLRGEAVARPLPTADTVIYFQEPKFLRAKI